MLFALGAYCAVLALVAASAGVAATNARKRSTVKGKEQSVGAETEMTNLVHLKAHATAKKPSAAPAKRIAPFAAISLLVVLLLSLAAGASWWLLGASKGDDKWREPTCKPPNAQQLLARYPGLEQFSYPIHTQSHDAQKLFDLGLLQAWNFNMPEALRAFGLASEADPKAAMPHWGQAYALGPFINRVTTAERKPYPCFTEEDFPAVRSAAQAALKHAQAATVANATSQLARKELALAAAMALKRWPEGSAVHPQRDAAEREYAEAMSAIGAKLGDAALLAMAGEAWMMLSPWGYYKEGELKENGMAGEEIINRALAIDPKQPLALHLHIHIAEESSPQRGATLSAGRAETSAAAMLKPSGGLWGLGLGHLLHMSSHTFVRIGRWHDAVVSNMNAYLADVEDAKHCQSPYEPEHNSDMLIYAANMGGEYAVAEEYSRKMRSYPADLPTAYDADYGREWVHLITTWIIQGKWGDILDLPGRGPPPDARALCPDGGFEYATVIFHYARTLALAAKADGARAAGDLPSVVDWYAQGAAASLARLEATEAEVVQEELTFPGEDPGIFACDYKKLARIAAAMGRGRVALMSKDYGTAEAQLRGALEIELGMGYMEPERLWQPVRHCLAYVLLLSGQAQAAAEMYVEDMLAHPDNGYALRGLAQALVGLNRTADAAQIEGVHQATWQHADGPLESSCPAFSKLIRAKGTGYQNRRRQLLSAVVL